MHCRAKWKPFFKSFFILIFSNSHDLWKFNNKKEKSVHFTVKNKFKKLIILFMRMTSVYLGHYNESTLKKRKESFWQRTGYAVPFSAEISCRLNQIKSLDVFPNLLGENHLYVVEGFTLFLVWCDISHFLNINILEALWKTFI
jgi:hypothetical protein